MSNRLTTWTLLALVLGPCLSATRAWAGAGKGIEITFDVSARDSHLGQGTLVIGPKGTAAQPLRMVTLLGKTTSLLGVIYAGMLDASSWVDAGYVPVEGQWQSQIAGNKARTRAKFAGQRVQAVFARLGKPDVSVDHTVDTPLLDPVALVPWLMHQKPKPGKKLHVHLFTGMDVCQATLEVGALQVLEINGQSRDAVPLSSELQGCRIHRKFTIWLSPKDQLPLKMVIFDKLLGTVDFVLAGAKTVTVQPLPPPSASDEGPPLPK